MPHRSEKVYQQLKGKRWFNQANGLTPGHLEQPLREFGMSRAQMFDFFVAVDTNGDGLIDKLEFVKGFELWTKAEDMRLDGILTEAGQAIDVNGDGKICRSEFVAGAGTEKDFAMLDRNGDGVLDAEELEEWFVQESDGEHVLCTMRLDRKHQLSDLMPSSADDFITVLTAGDRPLWTGADAALHCTEAQQALLEPLIASFNGSSDALERMQAVQAFLLQATQIEIATPQLLEGHENPFVLTRYDGRVGDSPDTIHFLADFLVGRQAHGMTLAAAVLRWCRFAAEAFGHHHADRLNVPLFRLDMRSFASEDARNIAYDAMHSLAGDLSGILTRTRSKLAQSDF